MNKDAQDLIAEIKAAFRSRKKPKGRLIKAEFDLNYHLEAQRVDTYIRTRSGSLDRHNSSLSAFYYMTAEAALWIAPFYMISIIERLQSDDFLIDILVNKLAGQSVINSATKLPLGLEMQNNATQTERQAVCSFLIWLRSNLHDSRLDEDLVLSASLWCEKGSFAYQKGRPA